jgi:hypothetical protein
MTAPFYSASLRPVPADDMSALYALRDHLLEMVQTEMGARNTDYWIGPTIFEADGPRIYFPESMTVGIQLSEGARAYWPTAVFETAHEVVHMLNPVKHPTTWFEEAVATDCGLRCALSLSGIAIPTPGNWRIAVDVLRRAFPDTVGTARAVREQFGAFSMVTAHGLSSRYPDRDPRDLQVLAQEFKWLN